MQRCGCPDRFWNGSASQCRRSCRIIQRLTALYGTVSLPSPLQQSLLIHRHQRSCWVRNTALMLTCGRLGWYSMVRAPCTTTLWLYWAFLTKKKYIELFYRNTVWCRSICLQFTWRAPHQGTGWQTSRGAILSEYRFPFFYDFLSRSIDSLWSCAFFVMSRFIAKSVAKRT